MSGRIYASCRSFFLSNLSDPTAEEAVRRFQQAMREPLFNRVVIWDDRALDTLLASGFKVLRSDGQAKLLGRDPVQPGVGGG